MELKNYQKTVLEDVSNYIEALSFSGDCAKAYDQLWDSKGYKIGKGGVPSYKLTFKGTPDVCLKVPTGGGKTFIACAALKTIFSAMPRENKIVMWLVPSSAILEQTKEALKNPDHPYRQRLNADFSGRVTIYDIEELLNGQNFSPQVIQDQLSICVLSYSSMRTSNPDNRRMYRQNGALGSFMEFTKGQSEDLGISPSLMGVINTLSPVIVLDESHNAGSKLTKKALTSMNPSFILELTATPKPDSNIISIVTAGTLKRENMVKIPMIVYGRPDVEHVLFTAMDYRNTLEKAAELEYEKTGRYLRPIALIQAQPKNDDESVTFDNIKSLLVKSGIPEEQIAIKVSTKDELKGVNLNDKDCSIRYIITVNALKEGWDCPFAYILASIARRSSETEVEQIIGRVLRQPGATRFEDPILNMSYVITSSKVFHETLQGVSVGLQDAGFTEKDYRVGVTSSLDDYPTGDEGGSGGMEPEEPDDEPETGETGANGGGSSTNYFDPKVVAGLNEGNGEVSSGENEGSSGESATATSGDTGATSLEGGSSSTGAIDPKEARKLGGAYEKEHEGDDDEDGGDFANYNRKAKMKPEYEEDALNIKIPRFMYRGSSSLFGDYVAVLSDKALTDGFKLSTMDRQINYSLTDINAGKWEIRSGDEVLKYSVLTKEEMEQQRKRFKEIESKDDYEVKKFTNEIIGLLNRMDDIETSEIKKYVALLIDDMSLDTLNSARRNPKETAAKIKYKIEALAKEYRVKQFDEKCTSSDILCDLSNKDGYYTFPQKIDPHDGVKTSIAYAKSLYDRCQGVSGLEERILHIIDRSDNVLWWHRVVSRGVDEFSLNGPIGHYPDFIVRTKTGVTVLIEAKGSQLDNPDTELKIKIGSEWEKCAGSAFKYFMVFEFEEKKAKGSISSERLEEYLGKLRP